MFDRLSDKTKNPFSKDPKVVEYTTFKPEIGDLSRFKVISAGSIEERLQKQIDNHNDKVKTETILGNIDSSLAA